MSRTILVTLVLLLLPVVVHAQDPALTDSSKYTVVLENERVRVLEYRDHPGEKTTRHAHPDFVLHALSDFRRRLTFLDGSTAVRDFKAGDVVFMKAQTHIGQNVGQTDTHVMIVELREPAPPPTAPPVKPN